MTLAIAARRVQGLIVQIRDALALRGRRRAHAVRVQRLRGHGRMDGALAMENGIVDVRRCGQHVAAMMVAGLAGGRRHGWRDRRFVGDVVTALLLRWLAVGRRCVAANDDGLVQMCGCV